MENNGLIRPEEILAQLDLRADMTVADFGSGHGYFVVPLAKMLPQGRVYALDVVKETLEAVSSKAKLEDVANVKIIHCDLEKMGGSKLENGSVDLVFARNILYQSQKKSIIIREAGRVMKEDGRLALIEWIPGAALAPKEGWLVAQEDARKLAEQESFVWERNLDLDAHHYGMVFRK